MVGEQACHGDWVEVGVEILADAASVVPCNSSTAMTCLEVRYDRVLEYPATPLKLNLAENGIRAHITRRQELVRSPERERACVRDTCLGALMTCNMPGVQIWSYPCNRPGVAGAAELPRLAEIITRRAAA